MKTKSFVTILWVAFVTVSAVADDDDGDFDRLDGTGLSGKKVHVIEWGKNLEIHAFPRGSLKGLALKIDKRNKDRPVMVIGYRFENAPQTVLIRRAILGIDLREGFKAYRDPSEDEFDKIVISNESQPSPAVAFRLDPEPKQLYPDGHPDNPDSVLAQAGGKTKYKPVRSPAEMDPADSNEVEGPDDSGSIRPFFMKGSGHK